MTSIRRLYLLTAMFGTVGTLATLAAYGGRNALGFLIGAAGSYANLWTFDLLAASFAPGEHKQKPWPASMFVGRYVVLIAVGYATVKTLDIRPLAVLLGLLASTAAALTSAVLDLVQSFFRKDPQ